MIRKKSLVKNIDLEKLAVKLTEWVGTPASIIVHTFLFIGSFFTALLTKSLFESTKLKKYSNVGFVISGITYIGTLWTVWIFYQTMAPYISNFAFLPLLLYLIYRYLKDSNSKNLLFVFLGSLVFSSVSVIATLFVADIFFIIFYSYPISV